MSSVGAHSAHELAQRCTSYHRRWSVADTPMAATTAVQERVLDSDWSSAIRWTSRSAPSRCPVRPADAIAMCEVSCGSARTKRPRRDRSGDSPFHRHARHGRGSDHVVFRLRNLSGGDCERRWNDIKTIRYANDFTAVDVANTSDETPKRHSSYARRGSRSGCRDHDGAAW